MGRKKPPAVIRKVSFDPEVDAAMQMALGRRSMSDFVNDAVVQRLARWESPLEFIQRKREDSERKQTEVFDPLLCHSSGFPLKHMPENPKAEVSYALKEGGAEGVKEQMQYFWSIAGIETEYTDAHLQATLQWYKERKGKKK